MPRSLRVLLLCATIIVGGTATAGALMMRPDGGATAYHVTTIKDMQCPASPYASRPVMRWTPEARFQAWKAGFNATLPEFLRAEALIAAAFFASMYLLGALVKAKGWNANYTRKILGAIMLAVPFVTARWFAYTPNPLHVVAGMVCFLLYLLAFAEPLRRRSQVLQTAFAAVDRPEDRPFTLTWFVSAYVASSTLLFVMMWWAVPDHPAFVFVALMAVAVGDLLAGAVGHRFGRHRYATRALFTDRTYTRSLEGSACVFFTTLGALFTVAGAMPTGLFILSALALPATMTFAEARSPHTWDEPAMILAAMVVSIALLKVWTAAACF